MTFLRDVKDFDRTKLAETKTRVVRSSGAVFEERIYEDSSLPPLCVQENHWGFVPDYTPDTQLAEVLAGRLYVGSQDAADTPDMLHRQGITHVLNVGALRTGTQDTRLAYKHVRITDTPETYIPTYFAECFSYIDQADGGVLVHCNAGVSRSVSVVIGYLMNRRGMTFHEAFRQVKEKRPSACPNPGFLQQLKHYHPEENEAKH